MQQWVPRRGPDSRDGELAASPEEDRGGNEEKKNEAPTKHSHNFRRGEKLESVLECLDQ